MQQQQMMQPQMMGQPMMMQQQPMMMQQQPMMMQPQIIMQAGGQYRTENYCGPITWLVGCFIFPCICMCPLDQRQVPF